MPGIETGRIPAEGDALRLGAANGVGDPEILAHVVEDELLAAGAADGVGERVDVPDRSWQVVGVMPRLVHQLDEDDGGLVFQRDVRIRTHVIQDLAQVVHLRGDGRGIDAHAALAEAPSEARRRGVAERVGPVGAVELNRAEQHGDAALFGARDQIVEQVEVIVGDEVARRVRRFPVAPEGEPHPVPPHAGELRHVVIDHALAVGVEVPGGAIVGRRREHVIRAEQRDLLVIVLPAYHALVVEVDALREREDREQDQGWYSRSVCPTSRER